MERLDFEQGPQTTRTLFGVSGSTNGRDNGLGPCRNRLISLRKYSLTICLIQAFVIVLFVYLLFVQTPSQDGHYNCGIRTIDYQSVELQREFVYNNATDSGKPQVLLLNLVPGCSQRECDLQSSVVCRSSQPKMCKSVEESSDEDAKQSQQNEIVKGDKLATVIVTSKSGHRLSKRSIVMKRVDCAKNSCKSKTKIKVLYKLQEQKIIGWGGALTDSAINNILSLTTNGTYSLLNDYFGPDGLMFNLVRITIGGSDFSSRFYTNDDSNSSDFDLSNFKLREEDILYKMPTLKLIQSQFNTNQKLTQRNGGKIKLFASMWSPPVWMKTNKHFNKGQLIGHIDDKPIIRERDVPQSELYYNSLAELKVNFISAYQDEGIDFWGLTVMNEPQFSIQPFLDFNTMIFPREDYANYVAKYLGPKLKLNPRLRHIKLMAHDDNRRFLINYTEPILNEQRVSSYLDGVSVHGYADEAYHLMSEIYHKHHRHPEDYHQNKSQAGDDNFFVLPTELCSGHLPFMAKALIGNWHRGVHYALDIIRSLQHAAAGWVDWNMALDVEGGPGWLGGRLDAPVIVDKARDLYHKSPMFYVLGQFSRYIPPGSIKLISQIENGNFDHHFEVISFAKNDASKQTNNQQQFVTVILNNNPYPIEAHLQLRDLPYSRDGENNAYYFISCPADSIQTIIYTA